MSKKQMINVNKKPMTKNYNVDRNKNYVFEEEFWKDCLATKETNVSKNISENDKRVISKLDVKQKIKKDILENINLTKEKDFFQDKLNLKKMESSKSVKTFKISNSNTINNEREYKDYNFNEKDKNKREYQNNKVLSKSRSLAIFEKKIPYKSLNNAKMKIDKFNNNSNNNTNKTINISNNKSNNNNNSNDKIVKTLNKSLSSSMLVNKKVKISPSLLNLINKQEEIENKLKQEKKNQTFNRTEVLYQINFKKNESIKNLKKQLDQYRQVYEIEECTFKPNIKSNYVVNPEKDSNRIKNDNSSYSIYDRLNNWKKKKIDVADYKKKLSKSKEFALCTFRPLISTNIPVYNDINSFDEGTIMYFERIFKARGEKLDINKKLNPNYNDLYEKQYQKNRSTLKQSASVDFKKDSFGSFSQINQNGDEIVVLKKSLHNQLHSINLNDFERY